MKAIYSFFWDRGDEGELDSLFVADMDLVKSCIGKEVDFGEALGEYSQVDGILKEEDLKLLSDDQTFVKKFIEILGDGTISGSNPIKCIMGRSKL